jgi:inhibitor of KinA sporulation pathway (predicted exonuclease)
VNKQRFFVRPDYLDGVTYYCTKLTGVTRSHVENAPPLSQVIKTVSVYRFFSLYLKKYHSIFKRMRKCVCVGVKNGNEKNRERETDQTKFVIVVQFDEYIQNTFLQNDEQKFCIVTDGIWDLQIQLRDESRRKNINLSNYTILEQYFFLFQNDDNERFISY